MNFIYLIKSNKEYEHILKSRFGQMYYSFNQDPNNWAFTPYLIEDISNSNENFIIFDYDDYTNNKDYIYDTDFNRDIFFRFSNGTRLYRTIDYLTEREHKYTINKLREKISKEEFVPANQILSGFKYMNPTSFADQKGGRYVFNKYHICTMHNRHNIFSNRNKYKNKIVRNIGIAIFSIVIIFWIWFFSWFFIDEDEELKSKMGEETTNNVSESTRGEDITSQVISNDSSIYKYGIIRKIKDDKITFINKENNIYILENKEQIKYINGRTSRQCKFSDLKEGYYINTSYDRTCYIYKNITGEELKKELLKMFSFYLMMLIY